MRGAGTGGLFAAGRRRGARPAVALLIAAVMTVGVVACGGGGSSTESGSKPTTLDVTFAAFPDYMDPALSYSVEGWTSMWETYVPLLTYRHASGAAGAQLIPGLARAMPKITDGGKTYTLYLRKGLRYSDGTPVRASDFGATIERALAMSSPGTSFYTDIVGAERFAATKKGHIAGIEADDASGRIVIHLVAPRGTFSNELAMLFAAPLPAGTRRKDLSGDPPPGTGPYEIVASQPGRGWEYRRNPEWATRNGRLLPQIPAGHYDSIDVKVIANPETAVNDVEAGKLDWMEEPPPPDRIAELRERFEGRQLLVTPQIDLYYFWMNVNKAPFDDLRVRRAVNYAIDPAALERIYAGTMRPLQQILPPAMPGHETYTPYPHDMRKAKELIAAADPKQRKITVFGNDYGANKQAAEYYEGVLRELGFEPTLKLVAAPNYTTVIGNESTQNLDTGWANWYIDYPHPNDYFAPQLSGAGIAPTLDSNYSRFSDPTINRKIAALDREPLGPKQEAAYARLDKEVMAQAPWAPFGSVTMMTFVASGIDLSKLVVSPVYGQDIATFAPR
ncbi:MAG TPA: ABC transporter substrate-binding protein [Solirubrobacterales bacterium]|nr:ABC transporter substrate-binding protein [Solirubrobacterales bacterium]